MRFLAKYALRLFSKLVHAALRFVKDFFTWRIIEFILNELTYKGMFKFFLFQLEIPKIFFRCRSSNVLFESSCQISSIQHQFDVALPNSPVEWQFLTFS